jgi:hypothetical protein
MPSPKASFALIERIAQNNGNFVLQAQREIVEEGQDVIDRDVSRNFFASALHYSEVQ